MQPLSGSTPGPPDRLPPRVFLTALPTFAVALAYAWSFAYPGRRFLWLDAETLAHALEIEMVVVYGGLFFIFPVLVPVQFKVHRVMKWGAFLALAATFASVAWNIDRWSGLASYVVLVYATFGSAMRAGADLMAKRWVALEAFGRWLVALGTFIAVYLGFDIGRFRSDDPDVFLGGATYFAVLSVVDVLWAIARKRVTRATAT